MTGERPPPRPRTAYRHWHGLDTRWADNDIYGHVNNVVHYCWFDTVVNRWLIDQGLLDVAAGSLIGLVVETGCRYFAPLAFPQTVELGLRVSHLGKSSVCYHLGVFAENGTEAAAEGFFVHVYVDRVTRRPVPLPETWRTAFTSILS